MAELNFDTGAVTYTINGKCEVCFNPTDSAFVKRVFETFERMDARQEAVDKKVAAADTKELFDLCDEMNREMRADIDRVLGKPVADELFGDINVFALANGLPIWCNLMLALIDTTDDAFSAERKKTNPRLAKYTAKYTKK